MAESQYEVKFLGKLSLPDGGKHSLFEVSYRTLSHIIAATDVERDRISYQMRPDDDPQQFPPSDPFVTDLGVFYLAPEAEEGGIRLVRVHYQPKKGLLHEVIVEHLPIDPVLILFSAGVWFWEGNDGLQASAFDKEVK